MKKPIVRYSDENGDFQTREATAEEIAEREALEEDHALFVQAEESKRQVSLIRSALFAIFAEQPPEVRAAFYSDKVNITAAFEDEDLEAALTMLGNIQTNTDDEAAAKQQMLELVAPLGVR